MTRRLRHDQQGFTLAVAVMVLFLAILFSGATLTFALRGVSSSQRDRRQALALQAAEAGADAAVWRMNKILVPNDLFSGGLFNLSSNILTQVETVGCLNVSANVNVLNSGFVWPPPQAGTTAGASLQWCGAFPSSGGAEIDNGQGYPQYYSFQISNAVNLNVNTSGPPLLERRIVATGWSGSVQRRLLVKVKLQLDASGNPTGLFTRYFTIECSDVPTGSSPVSGCPDPNN